MSPIALEEKLRSFRHPHVPGTIRVLERKWETLQGGMEVQSFLLVVEPNLPPMIPYVFAEVGIRSKDRVSWECDLLICPRRFREALQEFLQPHRPIWHQPRLGWSRLRLRLWAIRELKRRQDLRSVPSY